MLDEDSANLQLSLEKVKKICRALNVTMKIVFTLLLVCWVVSIGTLVYSLANPLPGGPSFLDLILCLAFGFVVAVVFVAFVRMFSDVSRGESPFSMTQVKRLRIIAAALFLYSLLDTMIANSSALFQLDSVSSGYASTNDGSAATVYFAPYLVAVVVFAFSFVFKYGVLLQDFSDEAL